MAVRPPFYALDLNRQWPIYDKQIEAIVFGENLCKFLPLPDARTPFNPEKIGTDVFIAPSDHGPLLHSVADINLSRVHMGTAPAGHLWTLSGPEFAIIIRVYLPNSQTNVAPPILEKSTGLNRIDGYGVWLFGTSVYFTGSGAGTRSVPYVRAGWNTILATGRIDTGLNLYVTNGQANHTSYTGGLTSVAAPVNVMNTPYGTDKAVDGIIDSVVVTDRFLEDSWCRWLVEDDNYYSLFRNRRQAYKPVSVGAPARKKSGMFLAA